LLGGPPPYYSGGRGGGKKHFRRAGDWGGPGCFFFFWGLAGPVCGLGRGGGARGGGVNPVFFGRVSLGGPPGGGGAKGRGGGGPRRCPRGVGRVGGGEHPGWAGKRGEHIYGLLFSFSGTTTGGGGQSFPGAGGVFFVHFRRFLKKKPPQSTPVFAFCPAGGPGAFRGKIFRCFCFFGGRALGRAPPPGLLLKGIPGPTPAPPLFVFFFFSGGKTLSDFQGFSFFFAKTREASGGPDTKAGASHQIFLFFFFFPGQFFF